MHSFKHLFIHFHFRSIMYSAQFRSHVMGGRWEKADEDLNQLKSLIEDPEGIWWLLWWLLLGWLMSLLWWWQGDAIRSFYLSSVLRSDMGEKRKKSSSFVLAKKLKTLKLVDPWNSEPLTFVTFAGRTSAT